MLTLISNDLLQNGYARFITKRLELFAILRDVPAFVNFQPAECQVWSAYTARQRCCLPSRISIVLRLRAADCLDALGPEVCMVLLCRRKATQCVSAVGVTLVLCECGVGAEALHLGLP